MTIAVAATFPWGMLRNVVTSKPGGGSFRGGVILATDSRWTIDDGSIDDAGQKLWPLAPERMIGAVFAGDVLAAEEGLELAKARIALIPAQPDQIGAAVSAALREIYSVHKSKRKDLYPLYVLLGMADLRGESRVLSFNYADDFAPKICQGIAAIGMPSARRKFLSRLPELEAGVAPVHGSWSLEISEWALSVVAHLFYGTIEPGTEPTVGGGVQIATLDASGWKELDVSVTSNPDDPSSWEPVSVKLKNVQQYHKKFNVPRLATGGIDVGVECLSNEFLAKSAAQRHLANVGR